MRHIKDGLIWAALGGVALLLVACGGDGDESASEASPTAAVADDHDEPEGDDLAALEADERIEIAMRDIAFEPTEVRVHAGEVVDLVLINEGAILHDLTIDEIDADVMEMMADGGMAVDEHVEGGGHDDAAFHMALDAGGSGVLRARIHEPGEYTFYCTVPGHREAGMVGTLIVE